MPRILCFKCKGYIVSPADKFIIRRPIPQEVLKEGLQTGDKWHSLETTPYEKEEEH